jgi:hypothetical protein
MSKDWKKLKKDLTRTTKVPVWVFILLAIGGVGAVAVGNTLGWDEGYWDGYNDAPQQDYEQYQYEIWLTYDYETRQQSFWSTIMWDVSTHTKEIFIVLTLFLLLLALRW